MFKRLLISLLLIASIVTASMGQPVVKQEEAPDQAKKESLTPDEEREARAFAQEFLDRLEKSGDVSPMVKELYVDDFPDRLRNHMDRLFPLAITPEVAAQMSSDEIIRAYAASINLMYMVARLLIEYEKKGEQDEARRDGNPVKVGNKQLKFTEVIPANVVRLIRSDPLLAAMLDEAIADENEEYQSANGEPDAGNASTPETNGNEVALSRESIENIWPFRSLDEVRHYTSLAEEGAKLLREHFDSRDKTSDEADKSEDELDIYPHVLESDWMGYSAGTHIICAKVLIFHMDMVRNNDGHLKVVSAYLVID